MNGLEALHGEFLHGDVLRASEVLHGPEVLR
jgi:hypothetical protein